MTIIQEQVATHTWNIWDRTLNWKQAGTDIHRAEDELMTNSCDSELVSIVTDEWWELRTKKHMWRMKTKTNSTWRWLWQPYTTTDVIKHCQIKVHLFQIKLEHAFSATHSFTWHFIFKVSWTRHEEMYLELATCVRVPVRGPFPIPSPSLSHFASCLYYTILIKPKI